MGRASRVEVLALGMFIFRMTLTAGSLGSVSAAGEQVTHFFITQYYTLQNILCNEKVFFIESLYSCSVLVGGNGSLVVANYGTYFIK
eukprot:COSAG01_NODE_1397_length_10467_cov_9.010706_12_plen_87_part_00